MLLLRYDEYRQGVIFGLLVIDAGVAGYLLFPKDDQRAPTASDVVVGSIDDAAQDSRSGSARVAGGVVMPEVPAKPAVSAAPAAPVNPVAPMSAADKVAMAPPSPLPQAGAQAGTQVGSLPPSSGQTSGGLVPLQPGQSSANSVAAMPSAPATTTAVAPAPSVAPDSSQVATGRIDNAAQPAAQPKPKPKARSTAQQKAQPKPGPRIGKAQARRYAAAPHPNGSNPVASMLTDQLVKESARPDPSLPTPAGIRVPSTQTPPGRGSNPVASAMTDQLVKESSRVAPMQQPTVQQPPIQQPSILKH
jgi:hypothetical protein